MQRKKKGTEELISKDKKDLGEYCHISAEFYEENTQFIIFLSGDCTNSQRGII